MIDDSGSWHLLIGGSGGIRAPDLPRMKRLHWTNYATLPLVTSTTTAVPGLGFGRWLWSGLGLCRCQDSHDHETQNEVKG